MADDNLQKEQAAASLAQRRGRVAAQMQKAGESSDTVRKYVAEQGDAERKEGREAAVERLNKPMQTPQDEARYASYRKGGKVRKSGSARLHKGERMGGRC